VFFWGGGGGGEGDNNWSFFDYIEDLNYFKPNGRSFSILL